jgi:hypothetical protein
MGRSDIRGILPPLLAPRKVFTDNWTMRLAGRWIGGAGLLLAAALLATALGAFSASAQRAAKPAATLGGCDVFPPFAGAADAAQAADQTAWNQDISNAPVDPNSDDYINTIQSLGNDSIHPDFGGNGAYGIPYTVVDRDQRRYPVHFNAYGDQSDKGPYPIPPNARVEGGGDRHVLALQRGKCKLYELYAAHFDRSRGRWVAGSGAVFNLNQGGPLRHDGWTSADAAGLPILPGLIRPGEVKRGAIHHAIRVTFDETRQAYIHPATHWASSSCDRFLPPMGLRMKLKPGYDISQFSGQARVIAVALQRYGVINADNGSSWYITGARSKSWNDNQLNQLKSIPGTAFEVVETQASQKTPC